ncbi:MAG TPA: Hpt domain-containing protein [Thioploca sp.]|nr:Hpt domain-containing protein [Thioploca sp.]
MLSLNTADSADCSPLDPQMLKHIEKIMGPEMTIMLIQQFMDYAPQQLAALQQSIAIGDTETLRQQAHQFKGESLQIGANQLSALCQKMETLAQKGQLEAASANCAKLETEWARVKAALTQVSRHE